MPDLHLRLHDEVSGEALPQPEITEDEALHILRAAEITTATLVPWGSNYTFAVALEVEDRQDHMAIYKPMRGERPLWDFPVHTLYLREHAAYLLSKRLGWGIVPPTVVRDGPHGIGSLQLYIEPAAEREEDYEFWGQQRIEIERMVLFDHITNNADRKLSHCLLSVDGRIWGIDHGLTFNTDPKLKTVLWQYVGQPIDADLLRDLQALCADESCVRGELSQHLTTAELDALFDRTRTLLALEHFPQLRPDRNIPYGWW
ncbi:MAG: SCO1664 family protein [Thermomicrobiales bacterium]